jgi:anti-sigma regulatory factor (Ser/Thr protein kinase)
MRPMAASAGGARVLDDLPVAVALVDREGTIRYVNPAAVARFGWRSADAAVGLGAHVLGEDVRCSPFHDEDGSEAGTLVVCLDGAGSVGIELLARASGVLAGALDPEASATAVGRLLVQGFADSVSVLVDDGGLQLLTAVNADPVLEELMAASTGGPVGVAVRAYFDQLVGAGRSVLVPVVDAAGLDVELGDATAAETLRALDVASTIVVGLRARGERLGVLAVTRGRDRAPFDQDDFVVVAELGARLAASIDGAFAQRARVEVARTLQASLLPPRLPEIPGLTLASRYDPIGDGSLVGGDFYDVFAVGDGRWCVVLGDVCGQGVPAAALTSLVRYTVRAAARMWRSPAEVLRFTNDAILDHDTGERFCTLLVATVRPDADGAAVTLAAGGHHLPLHRPAGGAPRAVGQVGTAMGLVRHPDVTDTTFRLGVGDVLVLTTDGVIEARDVEGTPGGDGFLEHLVDVHGDDGADALAGAIERAVLAVGGGRSGDDVAVVVLEATGLVDQPASPQQPAPPGGPFDERYPVSTASVTEARRAVGAWLEGQGIRGSRVPDLLLALTELATNAVRSARTAMEVRAWLTPDAVMFEVTDDGPGFDPTVPRSSRDIDPLAERGRGLFIVAALVDECTIESGPNGTIVRCYVAR